MPVETAEAGPVQTGRTEPAGGRTLVLVGGDPALAQRLAESGTTLYAVGSEAAGWPDGVRTVPGAAAEATTYEALPQSGEISGIVALDGPADAAAAVRALRAARPEAGVLVLGDGARPKLPRAALVRYLDENGLREQRIRRELHRLDAARRVRRLRAFAAGVDVLPILIQHDPDPDALASAMAVRVLLRRGETDAPIVSRGENRRPENRRMAELLGLQVTRVTDEELCRFEALVAVDMQPAALFDGSPRLAVIDHHPPEGCVAEFADIRPEIGATATLLTEYLRADDPRRIRRRLATALLYGIKTDTDSLRRGTTRADVLAYAFLQPRADLELLEKIQRPSRSLEAIRAFGAALEGIFAERDLVTAFLGPLSEDDAQVAPDLADFCLTSAGASWVVVGMRTAGELNLTLRHAGGGAGAGALAERLARHGGTGGGHATMARAVLPVDVARRRTDEAVVVEEAGSAAAARALAKLVRQELDGLG